MRERTNVQVVELEVSCQLQHRQGMVRMVDDVQVALLVQVVHHVLHVVLHAGPELIHAVQEPDQSVAEVLPDHGSPEDPCEEVPRRQVVLEGLDLVCSGGWRDVELEEACRVLDAPCFQLFGRDGLLNTLQNNESLNQGKASRL